MNSTSHPPGTNEAQPRGQVSVSPEGQVFPLPTPEDHAREILRLQELVEAQRSQGREIVVVMGPMCQPSCRLNISEDNHGPLFTRA